MKKFMSFSNKKKVIVVFGAILAVIVLVLIFKSNNKKEETIMVSVGDFKNQVSISGKVVPAEGVDLGFKSGGLVDHIYFKVGDLVKKGQTIAALDSADQRGTLLIAKSNYEKIVNGETSADINVAKAAVETAQVSLDQTKLAQDQTVANAKKSLLNSGFLAVTSGTQTSLDGAPIISGTYLLEKEGQMKITEYPSSGGMSFRVSGLIVATGMVSTITPQAIGTTGLYIKYPGALNDTEWIVNIPNTQSSQYLQNLNAYQAALSTRTQMIANSEAVLEQAKAAFVSKQASARPEDIAAANGSLLSAQGSYDDRFVVAPFDGQITKMDAKVGEVATPNVSEIAMMSIGSFQIESYVPEVNIASVSIGNQANVTLDAYGSDVIFLAKVVSIDPAETIRDGVSTYKTKLQFDENDPRVKSGMTANASITTFNKPNAIVIPEGVIFKKNGKKFVKIKNGEKNTDVEIITGSVSSLGQVEVVSGLKGGEIVVLNPV